MTQKMRLLVATFLTAFALVIIGGTVGGVATSRLVRAAPTVEVGLPDGAPQPVADDRATVPTQIAVDAPRPSSGPGRHDDAPDNRRTDDRHHDRADEDDD